MKIRGGLTTDEFAELRLGEQAVYILAWLGEPAEFSAIHKAVARWNEKDRFDTSRRDLSLALQHDTRIGKVGDRYELLVSITLQESPEDDNPEDESIDKGGPPFVKTPAAKYFPEILIDQDKDLFKLNGLILNAIEEAGEPTLLGFLPISEADQSAILSAVRRRAAGQVERFVKSMQLAPAAIAYAIAVGVSKSRPRDGGWWQPISEAVGLSISSNQHKSVGDAFRGACTYLGLLDVMPSVHNKYIEFIKSQAGILQYWVADLVEGVRRVRENYGLPDLEDPADLAEFARRLSKRIHNQPSLCTFLDGDGGPLLVERLLQAMISGQYEQYLPTHLSQKIKEDAESAGRSLRSIATPFLEFVPSIGEFHIHLPQQHGSFLGEQTWWRFEGGERISPREQNAYHFGNEKQVKVSLTGLKGVQDREYTINTAISDAVPFRLFRADGREVQIDLDKQHDLRVPLGEYHLVSAAKLIPSEQTCDLSYYHAIFDIQPGHAQEVSLPQRTSFTIRPKLVRGMIAETETEHGGTVPMRVGNNPEVLHFGLSGMAVHLPSRGDVLEATMAISLGERDLAEAELQFTDAGEEEYHFSINHGEAWSEAISDLEKGLYLISCKVQTTTGHEFTRSIYYWHGLEGASDHTGFHAPEAFENIDKRSSSGVTFDPTVGCCWDRSENTATSSIKLHNPKDTKLVFRRPGIGVALKDDSGQETVDSGEVVELQKFEKRWIHLHCGGFREWEIFCNAAQIGQLSARNQKLQTRLSVLKHSHGASGRIVAKQDGHEVPLFSYVSPDVATELALTPNTRDGSLSAKFCMPTKRIEAFRFTCHDLASGAQEVAEVAFPFGDTVLPSGLQVRTEFESEKMFLRLEASGERLESHIFDVSLEWRAEDESVFKPVLFAEEHGVSAGKILFHSHVFTGVQSDLWHRILRQASLGQTESGSHGFEPQEFAKQIIRLPNLLQAKFPTVVWLHAKTFLANLPRALSTHLQQSNMSGDWLHVFAAELALRGKMKSQRSAIEVNHLAAYWPSALTRSDWLIPDGDQTVLNNLRLFQQACQADSAAATIGDWYQKGAIRRNFMECFQDWQLVGMGQKTEFSAFDVDRFFGVLSHSELDEWEEHYGAGHLTHCLRPLRQRLRKFHHVMTDDSEAADSNLSTFLQRIAKMNLNLERRDYRFRTILGGHNLTRLALRDTWQEEERLANLSCALALLARAHGQGIITLADYEEMISQIFETTANLNLILSFAPELLTFWLGFWEITLKPISYKENR